MEKLEHPLLIVDWVNALFAPVFGLFGVHAEAGHHLIPNYLVMSGLIVLGFFALGLLVRTRLSVDNPSRFQIVLEDLVLALVGILEQFIGPKGRHFLPIIGALGGFILAGNYLGLVPRFMAPTSNINVQAMCSQKMRWSQTPASCGSVGSQRRRDHCCGNFSASSTSKGYSPAGPYHVSRSG